MAVRAYVDQVKNHVGFLAVYFFLAGMMKMKLHQGILFAVNGDAASGLIIHADGMAVVDNLHGGEFVIKSNWFQVGWLGVLNVDRCLALAGLASSKAGVEIAPMVRTIGTGITPVRRAAGGVLLSESRRGTQKEDGR